jgi:iron complex outermembrane receptor protein
MYRIGVVLSRHAASLLILSGIVLLERDIHAQGHAVAGVVVSQVTGQPIADAVVTIEDTTLTATTNRAGRFLVEGLPSGRVTVVIQARGFVERRLPDVRPSRTPTTIELQPTLNFLDRAQVTATKTEAAVGDVAAATDVIDRSAIESRGDQTLTQAIAHVPGAVVSTQLGIFESVMLRGMPRGDPEFTNTLLLIDGVPQTLSNNGARVVALPIDDASSIEVVRGPNSALYGRTAIGGAVNVRTAEPTVQREFGGEFTGGELGFAKGLVSVSGPVKRWGGYYVSGSADRNGGYFVNKTTTEFSDNTKSVFGKITFTPRPSSFGSISINHVDSKNFTPTNEPIINGQFLHLLDPRFDRFTNFNIPGPTYNQRETRFTVNFIQALAPWAKLAEVFGYRAVQHKFVEDGDFIAGPFDLAAHTVSMYPFSQQTNEDIAYQELRLELASSTARWKSALTVGGSYEWNSGKQSSDFIYNDPDLFGFTIDYLNPVIPPRSEWQHDTGSRLYHLGIGAVFAQYQIEPAPRLIVTAGGRYDRMALDNSRDGGEKIGNTFDAFSPKISATVKLAGANAGDRTSVNVYGAYSQSFLPPRRPSSLVPADVALDLKPEDIGNYEGGVKASLGGGRVSLEATVFRMTEDGVVLSVRQGPFFVPTNSGQLRYKGLETGAAVAVTPRLDLYANASFYRNRFSQFVIESADGNEILSGNRLPIAPDRVVNWGVTVRPTESIDATVNVKHMGSVEANRENTFALAGYSLLDAAVTWRPWKGRPVRVTVSGHNVTNEEYYWNADGETADPGRPRQVLVTTSVRFK